MSNKPWSVLDLQPQASVQDIRRAYARKLKTLRPDEDAVGFQALIEARDLALLIAEASANSASAGDQAGLPDATVSAAAVNEPGRDTQRLLVQGIDRKVRPAADVSDEPEPPRDPEIVEAEADLVRLANSSNIYFDLDGWDALLSKLGHLSTAERERLEPSIIGSFWNIMRRSQGRPQLPEVPADPKDRQLITLYDEEFGWSLSDGKIYQTLGKFAADQFKWRLSQIWAEQRPDHDFGRRGLFLRAERRAAMQRLAPRRALWDPRLLLLLALLLLAILPKILNDLGSLMR